MSSFTNTTIQTLAIGALILGAGMYYQYYASQRVQEAESALLGVNGAQMRAETTKRNAEHYVSLIADMENRKVDRQEPLSLVSEFSPQEISEVGPLLDTLYQRDGHFFLKHFEMTWRDAAKDLDLLPRVALDLEGRKVLLFSDSALAASVASKTR